jgi:hypothetical protein
MISRRQILARSALASSALLVRPAFASAEKPSSGLLARGLAALDRHRGEIAQRDLIALADFSQPSSARRFHLVNLQTGAVTSYLVAHGLGSDPQHTGWLQSFSNTPSSKASSAGAYRADNIYVGKHGRSIRLSGLDATNDNALARAIVVHPAEYVSDEIISRCGVLGRSDGCFTVSQANIGDVLDKIGEGRMIYADNIGA